MFVEVIDTEPTFTFIDSILFQKILKQSNSSRKKNGTVFEWLSLSSQSDCVSRTMENLWSRGAVGSVRPLIFNATKKPNRKHSALNFGPTKNLERQIKAVALKAQKPDSFILSLITLFTLGGECHGSILERKFTQKEYRVARENMCVMVHSQGTVLKSPKFRMKKFSSDNYQEANRFFR